MICYYLTEAAELNCLCGTPSCASPASSGGSLCASCPARMSGLNHSAVAFQSREQSFLLWCSFFMVMVVNVIIHTLTWLVEV